MKTMTSVLVLLSLTLMACHHNRPDPSANEQEFGGNSGGGGKGVKCGDKVMALDLYEAEVINHGTLITDTGDLKKNLRMIAPVFVRHFLTNKNAESPDETEFENLVTSRLRIRDRRLEL